MDKNFQKDMIRRQRKYRIGIIVVFVLTMIIAISISTVMSIRQSRLNMDLELQDYYYRVNDWVLQHRGILDTLGNSILAQPELLDDYDGTVQYLDDIKQRYPVISAIYVSNPDFSHGHAMVMNNGWVPQDASFVEEERVWYTGAVKSADGFYVTRPYLDARTGEYCLTFSKVLRGEDETFYGILAMDFYLDPLKDILNAKDPSTEYVFLVDRTGMMINHPYQEYNFSQSIYTMNYGRLYFQGGSIILKDYDHHYKVCASMNEPT